MLLFTYRSFSQELIVVDCSDDSSSGDVVIYKTDKKQSKIKANSPQIIFFNESGRQNRADKSDLQVISIPKDSNQNKMKTSEPPVMVWEFESFDKKTNYEKSYIHKDIVVPNDIKAIVKEISLDFGLDPKFVLAVIEVESGFNPSAVSPAGAIGLMQLMPETANGLGVDPWDVRQNIYGGIKYLRFQLDRFNSAELALAAYNAGPGAVIKYGGIPPYKETIFYVDIVMSIYSSK